MALLICVAGFAVYQHGLGGQFTNWDDNWLITENRHIRGLNAENLQRIFNPMAPREELGNEYLPVRDLSYAINYALDGLNPRGFQATNLLLHLFNSLLVMLLATRLTGRKLAGGLAGLLFAVHPVHVEAVSWLSSRKDLLAAFFLLLSTHLYLAARRARPGLMSSESFVQRVRQNSRLTFALSLLCFVLALLSKMPAVVLPALLVLIELFCGHGLKGSSTPKRLVWTAPFWGVALLFTALAMKIGTGLMREPYGDGRLQSTLTAVSAITRDMQALLLGWPMQPVVDMPVQTGFSLPVLAGLVLLLALIALGVAGWRVSRKGWNSRGAMLLGLCGLGGLWFVVSLAPVSNFAVQIGTVFAERYLYIPSIGIALALATLAAIAGEKLKGPARFAPVAAALLLCATWGWLTTQAVKPWRNSAALWAAVLQQDPENHTAWFNQGRDLQEKALLETEDAKRADLFAQALSDYTNALQFEARTYRYDRARVLAAMASVELQREHPDKALSLLAQASATVQTTWRSRDNPAHAERVADIEAILANFRGLALSALGRHDEAVASFEEALAKSSRYASARLNLAGEYGRNALAEKPINEDTLNKAWRQLADYEHERGRDEAAIGQRARLRYAEFSRRLELSGKGSESTMPPELVPLLQESRKLYTELLALADQGAQPRKARARMLVEAAEVFARGRAGDETAEKCFRQALTLDPDFVGLRTMLSYLLFERGGKDRLEANKLLAEELRQHPGHKPALRLKAAGLRQGAVDQAAALRQKHLAAYKALRGDDNPTWQGLIGAFYRGKKLLDGREEFGRGLLAVVALMRDAVETDPENEEGLGLIEGTGLEIALGMWFTREPNLRGNAEELLRTGFNARPEDGPVAGVLTQFYLELAEEVINPRKPPTSEEEQKSLRDGLNELLENMLTLSERARAMLSGKLVKVARDVADGRLGVRGADGETRDLSDISRHMVAAEFMRAAALLKSDNIEALDWLKHHYEEEGNLLEAVKVFSQLVEALKDKPQLLQGVNLSLAQLQADLGQQMLKAFNNKIKLGDNTEAKKLRDQAVRAYLDCLKTTGALIEGAVDPDKISFAIRLRGIAAQRLAYLLTGDAEKYYTIALQAYARAPLDFETEIVEVRRKRTWFISDPYKKLAELRENLRTLPQGNDTAALEQDILDLQRRIARIEADDLRRQGKLQPALDRLAEVMTAPTPLLYAARGDIYSDMARGAGAEQAGQWLRLAASDYTRAVTDPEALIKAASLLWEDEALMFEDNRISQARLAVARARDLLQESLETLDADDPARARSEALMVRTRTLQDQIEKAGIARMAAARRLHAEGKSQQALGYAQEAVEMLFDYPPAYQLLAAIQRALGRAVAAQDAAAARQWFVDARGSLQSALMQQIPLVSDRIALQLELAELLVTDLADKAAARSWVARARGALQQALDEINARKPASEEERMQQKQALQEMESTWKARIDEMDARIKG
ncbi:MAG: hypothetical protein IPP14_08005 [Planctomycetes bacterium]|nr:hypothetical protein [Planctomycetota bacterium]